MAILACSATPATWLIFADATGVGEALAETLAARGQDIARGVAGKQFNAKLLLERVYLPPERRLRHSKRAGGRG